MRRVLKEGGLPPETDAMSVVAAAFEPVAGKRVLDVGCGAGALARSLSSRGVCVVGVDPNDEVLAAARRAVPTGTFHRADAQALPFADRSFDGVVFLNSLHHVPKSDIRRALREAARVVKAAGPLVVVEPLAVGSFFSVLRLVEDETEVRAAAQKVVEEEIGSGAFEQLDRIDYLRREHFADLDRFLARVVAADPARGTIVEERRLEIVAAFRRCARAIEDGRFVLEQPMRAHVLTASA